LMPERACPIMRTIPSPFRPDPLPHTGASHGRPAHPAGVARSRLRRLAAVRFPQPRLLLLPRARPRSGEEGLAPLVLLDPGAGNAEEAGEPGRAARDRHAGRCPARVHDLAGAPPAPA